MGCRSVVTSLSSKPSAGGSSGSEQACAEQEERAGLRGNRGAEGRIEVNARRIAARSSRTSFPACSTMNSRVLIESSETSVSGSAVFRGRQAPGGALRSSRVVAERPKRDEDIPVQQHFHGIVRKHIQRPAVGTGCGVEGGSELIVAIEWIDIAGAGARTCRRRRANPSGVGDGGSPNAIRIEGVGGAGEDC